MPGQTSRDPFDDGSRHEPRDLAGLNLEDLRKHWRRQFGKAAPERLPKPLLAKLFGYRRQAARSGDLSRETIRFLDQVVNALEAGVPEAKAAPIPEVHPIKPGTILVREHGGTLHRVMILETGYAWNGSTWSSLSAVARAITGTRWNGHAFFGLNGKTGGRGNSSDPDAKAIPRGQPSKTSGSHPGQRCSDSLQSRENAVSLPPPIRGGSVAEALP